MVAPAPMQLKGKARLVKRTTWTVHIFLQNTFVYRVLRLSIWKQLRVYRVVAMLWNRRDLCKLNCHQFKPISYHCNVQDVSPTSSRLWVGVLPVTSHQGAALCRPKQWVFFSLKIYTFTRFVWAWFHLKCSVAISRNKVQSHLLLCPQKH